MQLKNYPAADLPGFGLLNIEAESKEIRETIETVPGNYMAYFDNVYHSITGTQQLIVQPFQAKQIIEVIETAIRSNELKQVLPF